MFKNNKLLRFSANIIALTVPLFLIFITGFMSNVATANYVFYVFAVLGGLWFAADSLSFKNYSQIFLNNEKKSMGVSSYILAAGLFAEFIYYCLAAYNFFSESSYIAGIVVFIDFYTGICALLSSVYFIAVGITFSGRRYDFRYLKVFHLFPLLWISGRMLELLVEAGVSSVDDKTGMAEFFVLTFAICFFFAFAIEVESSENTKRTTVLFAKELSYYSLLYVVSMAFELKSIVGFSSILNMITALTLCVFCFFFVRNTRVESMNTEN